MTLHVRNPHSVLAALETRPKDVLQIVTPPGFLESERDSGGAANSANPWTKVIALARAKGVKIVAGARDSGGGPRRDSGHKGRDGRDGRDGRGGHDSRRGHDRGGHAQSHQFHDAGRVSTAEAHLREREGISAEELFRGAKDRAQGKGLWLALDSLTDPQNVGAIFRSASFFGVQGIILTQERSAPLTSAVYDVSCGGVEYVPFTLQTNLQRAFEVAKDAGLWILGTSEHAKQSFTQVERDRPWLLVLGNEEKGMRRLTEESCDVVCQVPPQGGVTSLNVSVAAGVLISRLTN